MTDPTLSTEIANTPVPGTLLPNSPGAGNTGPSNNGYIPTPNVVPPYAGANANTQASSGPAPFVGNAATVLPLASHGGLQLNLSLNGGGLTGPASILAGLSNGTISHQAQP